MTRWTFAGVISYCALVGTLQQAASRRFVGYRSAFLQPQETGRFSSNLLPTDSPP